MKAILKFDLDNIEDEKDHMRCMKSSDMACFIWELKHNFWRKWKHDDTDFTLDNYMEALHDLMEEHNVHIDELID